MRSFRARSLQPLPWLLRHPSMSDSRAVLLGDALFALACAQLGLTTSASSLWLALPPLVVGLSVLRSLPASLVSKAAVRAASVVVRGSAAEWECRVRV